MNRGRKRKRRPSIHRGKKIQVNFVPVIVIICLSVCAGYLTAKYVVYPILGYEPEGLGILQEKKTEPDDKKEESQPSKETTISAPVVEDKVDVKQASGYAIQFGSYTTKAAAEKNAAQLKSSGIKAKVIEKDGAFKVIGKLFDTKNQAKAALAELDADAGAFVAEIK